MDNNLRDNQHFPIGWTRNPHTGEVEDDDDPEQFWRDHSSPASSPSPKSGKYRHKHELREPTNPRLWTIKKEDARKGDIVRKLSSEEMDTVRERLKLCADSPHVKKVEIVERVIAKTRVQARKQQRDDKKFKGQSSEALDLKLGGEAKGKEPMPSLASRMIHAGNGWRNIFSLKRQVGEAAPEIQDLLKAARMEFAAERKEAVDQVLDGMESKFRSFTSMAERIGIPDLARNGIDINYRIDAWSVAEMALACYAVSEAIQIVSDAKNRKRHIVTFSALSGVLIVMNKDVRSLVAKYAKKLLNWAGFHFQGADDAGVKAAAKLMAALFGAIFVGKGPTSKVNDRIFHLISGLPRLSDGMEWTLNASIGMVEKLLNVMMDWIGHEKLKLLETGNKDVDKWLDECTELFHAHNAQKLEKDSVTSDRISELTYTGLQLLNRPTIGGYGREAGNACRQAITLHLRNLGNIHSLYRTADSSVIKNEPFSILISGGAGVGKTALSVPFVTGLITRTVPEKELERLRKARDAFIYSRQHEEKFWTLYRGQWACVFDDYSQAKDVPGSADNEHFNLIRCVSPFKNALHMADIGEKGMVEFKSRLIFGTCNQPIFQLQSVVEKEAVLRRWMLKFQVYPARQFCKTGTEEKSYEQRKLDVEKCAIPGGPSWNKDVYRFREFQYDEGFTKLTYVGPEMTYDEALDYAEAKFNAHMEHDKSYQKEVNILIEKEINDRKEREKNKLEQSELLRKEAKKEKAAMLLKKCFTEPPTLFGAPNEEPIEYKVRVDTLPVPEKDDLDRLAEELEAGEKKWSGQGATQAKGLRYETVSDDVPEELLDQMKKVKPLDEGDINELISIQEMESTMVCTPDWLRHGLFAGTRSDLVNTDYGVDALKRKGIKVFDDLEPHGLETPKYTQYMQSIRKVFEPYDDIPRQSDYFKIHLGKLEYFKKRAKSVMKQVSEIISNYLSRYPKLFWAVSAVAAAAVAVGIWYTVSGLMKNTVDLDGQKVEIEKRTDAEPYTVTTWEPVGQGSRGESNTQEPKEKKNKRTTLRSGVAAKFKAAGQMGGDKTLNDTAQTVFRNTYVLCNPDEGVEKKAGYMPDRLSSVLMVQGRVGIINWHVVEAFKHAVAIWDESRGAEGWDPADKVILHQLSTGQNYEIIIKDIVEAKQTTDMGGLDVGLFRVTNSSFPRCRDIVEKFVPTNLLTRERDWRGLLVLPVTPKEGERFPMKLVSMDIHKRDKEVFEAHGVDYTIVRGFMYDYPTEHGDCGSTLLWENKGAGQHRILGIHCCGVAGRGLSTILHKEDLEEALKLHYPGEGDIKPPAFVGQMAPCARTARVLEDRFNVVGILPAPSLRNETRIMKSKLYEAWGPAKTGPAQLKPVVIADKWVLPLSKAVIPYAQEYIPCFDEELLKTCAFDTVLQCAYAIRKKGIQVEKRVFTFEEAVRGIEGQQFFKGIARNAGSGIPYKDFMHRSDKEPFFGKEGDYEFSSASCAALKHDCEVLEELLASGQALSHVYNFFPKDERRKLKRVNAAQTRPVAASGLQLVILYRRYFGAFNIMVYEGRIENGVTLGINPHSAEWHELYMAFSKFRNTKDMDFITHDATTAGAVWNHLTDSVNVWYKGDERDTRIRKTLAESWTRWHAVLTDVYIPRPEECPVDEQALAEWLAQSAEIGTSREEAEADYMRRNHAKSYLEACYDRLGSFEELPFADHEFFSLIGLVGTAWKEGCARYCPIIEIDNGMPSGHPGTAVWTSLHGQTTLKYKWAIYRGGRFDRKEFYENVVGQFNGDDNIVSVSDKHAKTFTPAKIAQLTRDIGQKVTGSDKNELTPDWQEPQKNTLLKMGWRKEPLLDRMVATLELDVILEMPYWTKSDGRGPCDWITRENFDTAIHHLSSHDDETWSKWAPQMFSAYERVFGDPHHQSLMKRTQVLRIREERFKDFKL